MRGSWRTAIRLVFSPGALCSSILLIPGLVAGAPGVADTNDTNLPQLQLREAAGLSYYFYRPDDARELLVSVHGVSRNAEAHARLWLPAARKRRLAIAAPLFDGDRHRGYQRLQSYRGQPRADRLLLGLLDQLEQAESLDSQRILLFGYSGGGQFAHRFALQHPGRIRGLGIGAAGWYTFPDPDRAYPLGLGDPRRDDMPRRFALEGLLNLRICVAIGDDDRQRDAALNTSPEIDVQQGTNRFQRAERWLSALGASARQLGLAAQHDLLRLPGIGHSFSAAMQRGGMGERMLECLLGPEP